MRVEVTPPRLSVVAGTPAKITVSVANTGTVISGHEFRVLGVDPSWVSVDQPRLSLFPGAAGAAVVTVTLPRGVPAGTRTIAIEVSELTPPNDRAVVEVSLTVPAQPALKVAVDPISVTGGSTAAIAVMVDNTGNSPLDMILAGADETGEIGFEFPPDAVPVAPGEQRITPARLKAPRPWFGAPRVRPFTISAGPPGAPVIAGGSWVQKPRLTRAALALTGLLAAATVFAVVIAVALSQVVGTSTADRNLALQVEQAGQGNGGGGTASIAGTVRQLGTATPAAGVTVEAFTASNTTTPIISTATDPSGAYHFGGLAAGPYKIEFQGAGFSSLWYPTSLTPDAASTVTLRAGQAAAGIDANIGGLPGTITGQVVGADPSGATVTLELPGAGGSAAAAAAAAAAAPPAANPTAGGGAATVPSTTPTTTTAPTVAPGATTAAVGSGGTPDAVLASYPLDTPTGNGSGAVAGSTGAGAAGMAGAVVSTQTIAADGNFNFAGVPSPGLFDLVVVKSGYAPAVQQVDLAGGEQRSGVVVTLHKGDGSISGSVQTAAGPLGGATLVASDGSSTVTSLSQTTAGQVGNFVLANLPTPDALTVTVSAPGYASQTLSITLTAQQQLTGVAVTLVSGTGSVSGTVTSGGVPAGGVTVTASNGQTTVSTVSLSVGAVGTYALTGLAAPGDYTLTFSRPDLATLTRAVALRTAAGGALTGVDANLVALTGAVYGTVTQTDGTALPGVTVQLTSGSTSYQVVTANTPTGGAYEIDGVTPGTYTISFSRAGGAPVSTIVTVASGQRVQYNPVLAPAASVYGRVVQGTSGGTAVSGAVVTLYLASQYPTVSTATVQTDTTGAFTFANVDAPQRFVLSVAFPTGSAPQETVVVQTLVGTATPVCGSQSTGTVPTTTVPATTTTAPTTTTTTISVTTTTAAPTTTTVARTTTTVAPTTTTTVAPSTTTTATTAPPTSVSVAAVSPPPAGTCNPAVDPLVVQTP